MASALSQFGIKHVARGIGRLATEVIESGSGSYVTMASGRKMVCPHVSFSPFPLRDAPASQERYLYEAWTSHTTT